MWQGVDITQAQEIHPEPTRPHRDHANGWACVDCLFLLANGETPEQMNEEETAAWLARIEAQGEVTLGRMYGEGGCDCDPEAMEPSDQADPHYVEPDYEHHAESCEQDSFSWPPCDVCGSHLGGSRDAVTFWFDAEPTPA